MEGRASRRVRGDRGRAAVSFLYFFPLLFIPFPLSIGRVLGRSKDLEMVGWRRLHRRHPPFLSFFPLSPFPLSLFFSFPGRGSRRDKTRPSEERAKRIIAPPSSSSLFLFLFFSRQRAHACKGNTRSRFDWAPPRGFVFFISPFPPSSFFPPLPREDDIESEAR